MRVKLRQLPEPGSPKDDHLKRLFRNRADRITLVDVSGTRMPHDHWVFKQIRTGLMCAPRSTVCIKCSRKRVGMGDESGGEEEAGDY